MDDSTPEQAANSQELMTDAVVVSLQAMLGPQGAAAELAQEGHMSLEEAKQFMGSVQKSWAMTHVAHITQPLHIMQYTGLPHFILAT